MKRLVTLFALAVFLNHSDGGQVRLTLGFESDSVGSPPLGASLSQKGSAYITNSPSFTGTQSLALVSTGQVAVADWGSFFPDCFAGWYQQVANLPLTVTVAARAAQTNATLDLFIAQCAQQTAARIQFTPQGNLVVVTAEGTKQLMPYVADTWYQLQIALRTSEPRWHVKVLDAKGAMLAAVTNLPWADLALTNGVLFGFSFRAQEGGKLFVDDFRIQDVEPVETKPWPRKLVVYPKESK